MQAGLDTGCPAGVPILFNPSMSGTGCSGLRAFAGSEIPSLSWHGIPY